MTADLTPDGRRLGGTVSYAARTVNAFGLRAGIVTSAATNDPLLAEIEPYTQVKVVKSDFTSTFENVYEPDGGRKQYIRAVASPIGVDDIPPEWLSTPLVHLGPLTNEVDPQIAHILSDATVLMTIQGWLRRWGDDGLVHFKRWHDESALKAADIVVYSEEDIVEAPDLEQIYANIVDHLVVTRAEKGGTYYHNGQSSTYNSLDVPVEHLTGAGDIFAAALLAALPRLGNNMQAAIRVAAKLGAISVTRTSLDGTPTPEEVQQALAESEA